MRRAVPWLVLGAAIAVLGRVLDLIHVPSPYLFGALLLGLLTALRWPGRLAMPELGFSAGQAVAGVTLGIYLQADSLSALADDWLPVTLVSASTLAVSLLVGVLLAKVTEIDKPTAALGMIAGGASGIVTMARDLGGDDRLVAFMQYARILVVVLLTSALIPVLFPGTHGASAGSTEAGVPTLGDAEGWLVTIGLAVAGTVLARALRIPSPMMLGTMIFTGILTLTCVTDDLTVPPLLRETAFAVIGVQIGLRFTVTTLRQVGKLLLPVLLGILFLMATCLGLAVILAATTSVTMLDAYLATTPGGLYAVLAVAFGAGANTTFIIALQGLRVLVMVLLAPMAVRWMLGPVVPAGAVAAERAR